MEPQDLLVLVGPCLIALGHYWREHDKRYEAGLEKHPFFSLGGSRSRRKTPQKATARRPVTQAEIDAALHRVVVYTHSYDVAQRLLVATISTYRGRSFEWCVDKTIHDIVRDRR